MALEPLFAEQAITYKRYLLLKRFDAMDRGHHHLAGAWRSILAALPVVDPLPVTFPYLSHLQAAGYTERAHLAGASVDELMQRAGLERFAAEDVLAALVRLPSLTT